MKTIRQFLDISHRSVYSVGPNATVREALEIMAQHNIGALLVLEGSALAGIFSERDYARKVTLKGKSSSDLKVSEIMTSKVITIDANHTVDQCMQIM
ncbi:MAG: CBS domain-containing protein, partial [Betaproteobacteria bacterium]|nr:CBS domain-containing protein [Betaproteobacteria bacterium]